MKSVKWNRDTASAKTLPVCVLPLALVCCSAFIPTVLRQPAFKIPKLVHADFTSGGTVARNAERNVATFLLEV